MRALALVILVVPSLARAYDFQIDAETIGQAYQLRAADDALVNRRRIDQYLGLHIFNLGPRDQLGHFLQIPSAGAVATDDQVRMIEMDRPQIELSRHHQRKQPGVRQLHTRHVEEGGVGKRQRELDVGERGVPEPAGGEGLGAEPQAASFRRARVCVIRVS